MPEKFKVTVLDEAGELLATYRVVADDHVEAIHRASAQLRRDHPKRALSECVLQAQSTRRNPRKT